MREEIPLEPLTQPTWQRRDLVLVLLHDEGACARCDAVASVLAGAKLPKGPLTDPELSVRVVRGGAGNGIRHAVRASDDAAIAVVADRFLELFAVLDAHGDGAPVEDFVRELEGWADAVARQCGECSRVQWD